MIELKEELIRNAVSQTSLNKRRKQKFKTQQTITVYDRLSSNMSKKQFEIPGYVLGPSQNILEAGKKGIKLKHEESKTNSSVKAEEEGMFEIDVDEFFENFYNSTN